MRSHMTPRPDPGRAAGVSADIPARLCRFNGDDTASDIPVTATRRVAAEGLQERFPGASCWWGSCTRRWWAWLPMGGMGRLIEADSSDRLAAQIIQVGNGRWR